MKTLLLALILLLCGNCYSAKYELVICALFQDEEFYLKEWLDYHSAVGVQHFYLYNNLSSDDCYEILKPYINEGRVDLFDWPIESKNQQEYLQLVQIPIYNHALKIVQQEATWAAFIDLDEFIVPHKHSTILEMLQDYADFPGLAINWQLFGTSGLQTLPEGESFLKALIWKAPPEMALNRFVKLIVQPNKVESINNAHSFHFKKGMQAVNSRYTLLDENQISCPVTIDTVQINHYYFGTRDWFFKNKLPRKKKWGMHFLPEHLELYNDVQDRSILRFWFKS